MYIWVILATFIVTLYTFNLSYRSDIRKIEVEPVAEAVISKLVIKHQASARYMRANMPPYSHIVEPDGTHTPLNQVTYNAGTIDDSKVSGYLPFGFKNTDDVVSEIYCVDKDSRTINMSCNDEDAVRMLVSFTEIPQRWLNVKTGNPNNDFLNAMKTIVGNNPSFGYTICKEGFSETDPDTGEIKCKKTIIQSKEGVLADIPDYINNNGDFANKCGSNKSNAPLCLIYIYEYKFIKYY